MFMQKKAVGASQRYKGVKAALQCTYVKDDVTMNHNMYTCTCAKFLINKHLSLELDSFKMLFRSS